MKQILTIFTLLLSLYSCKAQTSIYNIGSAPEERTVVDNYYYKDINNQLAPVLGTWIWQDNNSTLEITFEKFEMYNYPNSVQQYWDAIFGKYKYSENNVIISEVTQIETFPDFKLHLSFVSSTEYDVFIRDIVSGKSKIGKLVLSTQDNTATLELSDPQGVKVGNTISFTPFSLPTSVILTKQ